ncbi:type IV secretion system protein VirB10 [Sulfuriferula sp.]|uniref:type IV secretion system protein VirB10 n=1 Tax=Sulfuriferula sp. TaxID=2025307 RepID=UPI0027302998|nr:type IV secretion system protein VirB10 [Sulfuriferula sp.]MDP2027525.1 type IV secretion system protein VirB10 [Sulfuriferula sp.]
MSLFDKFKGEQGKPEDGLPNMEPETPTLADAVRKAKSGEADFRVRETAEKLEDENEGLPSVNRRRGGNKLVTVLGFIFILGAAAAMLVAVNSDKDAPKKKHTPRDEKIANNLPPLVMPPAPARIDFANTEPMQGAMVPAIAQGAPGTQPIPLQAGKHPAVGANGKPVLTWQDRKMGGLLLVDRQGNIATPSASPARLRTGDTEEGAVSAFAGEGSRSGGGNNELGASLQPTITKGVSASVLADRNFLITKGTALDCALETALDSTVPGLTTCRLTRDVYSDNGQVLLLDRGSQLVGEYQGGIKQGQVRLFVLWTRAKTPNGVVVSLNSPGTDALGRSGLTGWVDNHFMERFGAAILLSFINSTLPTLLADNSNSGSGTTNIYSGSTSGAEKVVEKILESTVNIPPTIIKNQGDHIQVMVARDMDFSSVYALRVKQ